MANFSAGWCPDFGMHTRGGNCRLFVQRLSPPIKTFVKKCSHQCRTESASRSLVLSAIRPPKRRREGAGMIDLHGPAHL